MTRRARFQAAKVFHVSLDQPLRPLEVEHSYREVLLIVTSRGRVVGQVVLPALAEVPVDFQRRVIAAELGPALWRCEINETVARAFGVGGQRSRAEPTVSVVVCTRNRPDDLRPCIESLLRLATPPHEIIVVDNAPSDGSTRELCGEYPLSYVLEELPGQSRARNRGIVEATGELVAFTDDDVVVDPHWLDGLGADLVDPLTMAVTGYVGPLELETRSQYLFEMHGGFGRGFVRKIYDGVAVEPATAAGAVGAGANSIFRRRLFDEIGLFAEDLGPGTPARAADDNDIYYRILAAGYRIVFDPARVVWHSHRRDDAGLRKVLYDYTVSSTAFATRRLLRDRDLGALRIWTWWWFHHFPADLGAIVRRRRGRLPLRMVLAEMGGMFTGPWHLWRSQRSRRAIPPLELPDAAAPARPPIRPVIGAEAPSLSVVIPSHNRRETLRRVLEAVATQSYPADRIEGVVVLDGATDGSADMVRALELPYRIELIEREKAGIGAVRNEGVRAARHPLVLFLDDDIVPEPGCLAAHAGAHERFVGRHVLLGYCPPVIDGSWWSLVIRKWWEDHYRRKSEPGHQWSYVDFTTGNASLPRTLILDAGGFDESFQSRHEDWELAIRLLERGVSLGFSRETTAWHHLDTSLASAARHQRQEARDDVVLARKHPHVMGQLPLAAYTTGRPTVDEGRLPRHIRMAGRFEQLGMRRSWRRVTRRVLRDSYALGLVDAVPHAEEFFALLAPVWTESVKKVGVDIAETVRPSVPSVGSVELAVSSHGAPLGRVVAVDSGAQWDWREVSERVAGNVSEHALLADVAERLFARPDAVPERLRPRAREHVG